MEYIEHEQAYPETAWMPTEETKLFEKKEFCTSHVKFEMLRANIKIAIKSLNVKLNVEDRCKGRNMKKGMDIGVIN